MEPDLERAKYPMIEKDQILTDLKRIGISKGDHVAVALSFKSMGTIEGGPAAFLEALFTSIGAEGTIMVNTFTDLFPISEIPADYVFDPFSTIPNTGLIPRVFLKLDGAIRSHHPIVSVAAIGRFKEYLTSDHDEHSNWYLPYEKLARIDGKYLFIGTGNRLVGIRHEAQRRAGLWIVPMYHGVQYQNGGGKHRLFVCMPPPCAESMFRLTSLLEDMRVLKKGKIGNADSILAPAGTLLETMTNALRRNPAIGLCDSIFCLRCRELERRLNLYKAIPNPKLFQRSLLLRRVISLRNKLMLRRYSYLAQRRAVHRRRMDPTFFLEIWLLLYSHMLRRIEAIESS
jgi:aminoglycoside 3-N-acetyltransferase